MIPAGVVLRVIGDVHGDMRGFAHAVATEHFIVQLGDLVDYGPDSAGVLRAMFDLIDAGRGIFLLGNHDHKLARLLAGRDVSISDDLRDTLAQLDDTLGARAMAEISRAPAWLRAGGRIMWREWDNPADGIRAWAPELVTRPPASAGGCRASLVMALMPSVVTVGEATVRGSLSNTTLAA